MAKRTKLPAIHPAGPSPIFSCPSLPPQPAAVHPESEGQQPRLGFPLESLFRAFLTIRLLSARALSSSPSLLGHPKHLSPQAKPNDRRWIPIAKASSLAAPMVHSTKTPLSPPFCCSLPLRTRKTTNGEGMARTVGVWWRQLGGVKRGWLVS